MPNMSRQGAVRRFRSGIVALLLTVATVVAGDRYAVGDNLAEGRTYYMRYCASCHGVNADGQGYMAQVLVRPPSDLRRFSERYGASLDAERLARFIDGREKVGAHGERDMPVWGERFYDIEAKGSAREKEVRKRIDAIVAYILSIEVKGEH